MKKIIIYTDGSCLGNPGPGGFAAIIQHDSEELILKGGSDNTTNNRMEMTAILKSLKWLIKNHKNESVEIYSDSSLVIQTIKQGWKKKANTDIWIEIDEVLNKLKTAEIKWHWVKGHAENKYNEMADKIAVEESKKIQKKSPAVKSSKAKSGYFCNKCKSNVKGKLGYLSESEMIRVDCEKCGSYIKFAEKTKENLKEAKKKLLVAKNKINQKLF